MKARPKIGIYSGSSDPIHLGHITFALQAIEAGNLTKVYFLPERQPRDKYIYEHFGHRVAMIKRAIKPHPKLELMEVDDKTFTIKRTLPRLEKIFNNADLVFLFGSDKVASLIDWPNSKRLLDRSDVIIGLRQESSVGEVKAQSDSWSKPPLKIIDCYKPGLVSTKIRESLQKGQDAAGLARSVAAYIRQNWLYISIP